MRLQLVKLLLAASTVAEGINAFKMSPQDKAYGDISRMDSTEKFSAPQKAPVADDNGDIEGKAAVDGDDSPTILDDYHPNRLGKSAQEESSTGPEHPKESAKVTDEQVKGSSPPVDDPKAGLSSGKGDGSGGVGAKADEHADIEAKASKERENVLPGGTTASAPETVLDDSNAEHVGRFLAACSMIVFSELGDKTFFIAVLFAMRCPQWFVFSASFGALAIMTILSAILGRILPSLLSPKLTTLAAAGLFFVFGAKMIMEGMAMSASDDASEEMHEVEHEIEAKSNQDDLLEKGLKDQKSVKSGLGNLFSFLISPLWVQIFLMTFLGEWGDRSQIATIAMGAGSHYWQVVSGSIVGHALCTLVAITGGKLMASKLSLRTITLGGAACFLLFGFIYTFDYFHS